MVSMILAAVAILFPGQALAAGKLSLEALVGVGYSVTDMEKWSGKAEDDLDDYDQMMYRFDGRLFFTQLGEAQVAAEIGWQHLLWYEWTEPYGSVVRHVERYWEPMRLGGIIRYPLNEALDLDLGAGLVMFEDFTDFGLSAALTHQVPLSEGLYLPISVRGDIILDDPIIIPIGICVGIRKVL